MKKHLLLIVVLCGIAFLHSAPVISDLTAVQRVDESKLVDIYYSVANTYMMTIALLASNDNGATWTFSCSLVTGDVGANISPGTGKHIVWDVLTEHPNISGNTYMFKIIADDGMPPPPIPGFVLVQGGSFALGAYTITLSSFYIGINEVTQTEWVSVMGSNPSYFTSVPNGPVENTSWFKMIEYCNRRSMNESLTPCYSYGSYGTNPAFWPAGWNSLATNHTNVACDWSADGYRLPTEMQWMFAAKGGNLSSGYTYSGSNNVSNVAWYYLNSGNTTHSVGTKTSNELGLYDMSGNVSEFCWNIWASQYPSGNQTDPTGPTTGTARVLRGGSWGDDASMCTVAARRATYANWPTTMDTLFGFRLCRKVPGL